MRWVSPIGTQGRRTTEAVSLGGVDLPAEAPVAAVISAANRDPDALRRSRPLRHPPSQEPPCDLRLRPPLLLRPRLRPRPGADRAAAACSSASDRSSSSPAPAASSRAGSFARRAASRSDSPEYGSGTDDLPRACRSRRRSRGPDQADLRSLGVVRAPAPGRARARRRPRRAALAPAARRARERRARARRRRPHPRRVELALAAAVSRLRRLDGARGRRSRGGAGRDLRRQPRRHRARRRPGRAPGGRVGGRVRRLPVRGGRVHERRHDLQPDRLARRARACASGLSPPGLCRAHRHRLLQRGVTPFGRSRRRGRGHRLRLRSPACRSTRTGACAAATSMPR